MPDLPVPFLRRTTRRAGLPTLSCRYLSGRDPSGAGAGARNIELTAKGDRAALIASLDRIAEGYRGHQ